MSINVDSDKDIPIETDAYYEYYEELACQEELYLEEIEEEVVTILTSYVSPASQNGLSLVTEYSEFRELDLEVKESMTDPKNDPCLAEKPDGPLVEAVEELITGDADDPPLSEGAIFEMLRITKS